LLYLEFKPSSSLGADRFWTFIDMPSWLIFKEEGSSLLSCGELLPAWTNLIGKLRAICFKEPSFLTLWAWAFYSGCSLCSSGGADWDCCYSIWGTSASEVINLIETDGSLNFY
jgi:hypothetical protein